MAPPARLAELLVNVVLYDLQDRTCIHEDGPTRSRGTGGGVADEGRTPGDDDVTAEAVECRHRPGRRRHRWHDCSRMRTSAIRMVPSRSKTLRPRHAATLPVALPPYDVGVTGTRDVHCATVTGIAPVVFSREGHECEDGQSSWLPRHVRWHHLRDWRYCARERVRTTLACSIANDDRATGPAGATRAVVDEAAVLYTNSTTPRPRWPRHLHLRRHRWQCCSRRSTMNTSTDRAGRIDRCSALGARAVDREIGKRNFVDARHYECTVRTR